MSMAGEGDSYPIPGSRWTNPTVTGESQVMPRGWQDPEGGYDMSPTDVTDSHTRVVRAEAPPVAEPMTVEIDASDVPPASPMEQTSDVEDAVAPETPPRRSPVPPRPSRPRAFGMSAEAAVDPSEMDTRNPGERIAALGSLVATRIRGGAASLKLGDIQMPRLTKDGPRRKPGRIGTMQDVIWEPYEDLLRDGSERMLPNVSPMADPLVPTNPVLRVLGDEPYLYRGGNRVKRIVEETVGTPDVHDGLAPEKKKKKYDGAFKRKVADIKDQVIEAEQEIRGIVYESQTRREGMDALFLAAGMEKNTDYRLVIDDADEYAANPSAVSYEITETGFAKLEAAAHHFGRINLSNTQDLSPDSVESGERITDRDLEALDTLFFIVPDDGQDHRPDRSNRGPDGLPRLESADAKDREAEPEVMERASVAGGFIVATQYVGPDFRDRDSLDKGVGQRWRADARHLTDGQMNRSMGRFLNGMTEVFGPGVVPIYVSPLRMLEDSQYHFKASLRAGQARTVEATHEAVMRAASDVQERAVATRQASEAATLELAERTGMTGYRQLEQGSSAERAAMEADYAPHMQAVIREGQSFS